MYDKALTTERAGATVTDLGRVRAGGSSLVGRDGERLTEWLIEAFALHSDDRPVVIYLRHITSGRRLGDKLGTIQLKALAPEQRDADAAPEMAHALWAKAENYAAGLGGASQQFGAHAYYEDDPSESESGTFFWIKVNHQAEQAIDTLPANETGVLRLVMGKLDRFEDNFCDLMTGSVTMMQCMREQIRDMHQQALEDRRERRENEDLVRKAKLAELDREAQRESAKADQAVKRDLGEAVKAVGFAVARKWGGLDVRDAMSPGSQQLMQVFESLASDEGRFMEILSRLSPIERTSFMEWWNAQIQLKEELAKRTAGGASTPTPTPQVSTPAASSAPPTAPAQTSAEQAATARRQAEQWAAVAAALEAEARGSSAVATDAPPTSAPATPESSPQAQVVDTSPTPTEPPRKTRGKKRKD